MINRRELLKSSMFLGGLAASGIHLPVAKAQNDGNKTLIVVFLRGGCDGLNAVVPYGDANYYHERGQWALPAPGDQKYATLDLDGFFGLNSMMAELMPVWQRKQLAVFPAVHYSNPIFSHFAGQDRIEFGSTRTDTGWLYRHLVEQHGGDVSKLSPYEAIAVSGSVPRSLAGRLVLPNISPNMKFSIPLSQAAQRKQYLENLNALVTGPGSNSMLDRVASQLKAAMGAQGDLEHLDGEPSKAELARYPDTEFGKKMLTVSRLIRMNLGTKVFALSGGGWDTHLLQGAGGGSHSLRLRQYADAMAAFMKDMGETAMANTLIVTMTEFGRSVKFAGTGTDHGNASAWFAMGGGVKGGVYGEWPGLSVSDQYQRRYLAHSIDYNDILSEAMLYHTKSADIEAVFPEHQYQPIGYLNT